MVNRTGFLLETSFFSVVPECLDRVLITFISQPLKSIVKPITDRLLKRSLLLLSQILLTMKPHSSRSQLPQKIVWLSILAAATALLNSFLPLTATAEVFFSQSQPVNLPSLSVSTTPLPAREPERFRTISSYASLLKISPNQKILAGFLAYNHTIQLWDIETGAELLSLKIQPQLISTLAFSPDGNTLASSSYAFDTQTLTIQLWNLQTGTLLKTLSTISPPVLHRGESGAWGYISSCALAWSPDGKTLASTSGGNTVQLWDVARSSVRFTLKGHIEAVRSLAFSPDGQTLASGGINGTLKLWVVNRGQSIRTLRGTADPFQMAFSSDGQTLATAVNATAGNPDRGVQFWNLSTGKPRQLVPLPKDAAIAFSADGTTYAWANSQVGTTLVDLATNQALRSFKLYSSDITLSHDGQLIAAIGGSGIEIWHSSKLSLN